MKKLKRLKCTRYKVVKKNRVSCVINGNSPYSLKYLPGTEVYARPETLGIMTFETKESAYKWKCKMFAPSGLKVIEVIPMGRGKFPQWIAPPRSLKKFYDAAERHGSVRNFALSEERRLSYYTFTPTFRFASAPDKTLCYPAVYVVN